MICPFVSQGHAKREQFGTSRRYANKYDIIFRDNTMRSNTRCLSSLLSVSNIVSHPLHHLNHFTFIVQAQTLIFNTYLAGRFWHHDKIPHNKYLSDPPQNFPVSRKFHAFSAAHSHPLSFTIQQRCTPVDLHRRLLFSSTDHLTEMILANHLRGRLLIPGTSPPPLEMKSGSCRSYGSDPCLYNKTSAPSTGCSIRRCTGSTPPNHHVSIPPSCFVFNNPETFYAGWLCFV